MHGRTVSATKKRKVGKGEGKSFLKQFIFMPEILYNGVAREIQKRGTRW